MRIYLKLNRTSKIIPFNYQHYLTGAIHKWIGNNNELHGQPSLYSFSWLLNVDINVAGIKTKDTSFFFIGAHDEYLIKRIIKGILEDPSLFFDICITDIQIENSPGFTTKEKFFTASPIFIKRRFDNEEKHITYADPRSSTFLTETLQKKLQIAGLLSEGLRVSFDTKYPTPKTKIITYKIINNKVNVCPIIIEGSPEQIAFAWNVGVGNSTGIGFGALK